MECEVSRYVRLAGCVNDGAKHYSLIRHINMGGNSSGGRIFRCLIVFRWLYRFKAPRGATTVVMAFQRFQDGKDRVAQTGDDALGRFHFRVVHTAQLERLLLAVRHFLYDDGDLEFRNQPQYIVGRVTEI